MLHSALHPGFSAVAGTGLVALRDIPMGTVLWGPCPQCRTWDAAEQLTLSPRVVDWLDEFGYRLADRSLLLPCRGAHLLNHSCEATVLDHGLAGGLAVRDIRAGEEVTGDYRTFRYDEPWEFDCRCGAGSCPGSVRSSAGGPPAELAGEWDRRMAPALAAAAGVPQELPLRAGQVDGAPAGRRDPGEAT
ncbi:SET domain-containing protein-lysine N-methyltransferase [Kitasatospora purpeofusca]|uniref:SET domain-containing protein-lysine N-methyltransferase n=1 Tax=Kitasatospora purpeofusca TaxID=67352 RepID=UPI0004C0B148|nr:SET domain-containing protein [Kitasatospora purpeofusca]